MDVHVDIAGAHQVAIRFDEFPDDLYEALKSEIGALSEELLVRVQAATPDRTGRLRSEERVRLFTDPNRISGYVDIAGTGADFAKAGALEYGAHRSTKVSAHSMRLDHYWSTMLAEPETVMVAAYSRIPDIAEVAFERGPLGEMAPEIFERLNAVVETAVATVNK